MTRALFNLTLLFALAPATLAGPPPSGTPDAVIDLATPEGAALVHGQWRYSDARIVEVDFVQAGSDRKPSGPPNRTWDIAPHAGGAGFDDSAWPIISPTSLQDRRSSGRLCFAWYRIAITMPPQVDGFDTAGATAVLDVVVDDYAEVWVDGALPRAIGQRGMNLVAGWNAPNRVVLAQPVVPGQTVQVAVFGANGPMSDPPPNYIWMRSARIELFAGPRAVAARQVPLQVVRRDAAMDQIVPPDARLELVAQGLTFGEGPLWAPARAGAAGRLLFSDPNQNTIHALTQERLEIFRARSGYQGDDIAEYVQPGSNGLTLDAQGRLVICEHGNRRVSRLEPDGSLAVLADRFEGKRLNSPNDVVLRRSDGVIYFTDPPFGLPKAFDDPRKELPFSGVYRVVEGRTELLSRELTGPNGLAFSPDERYLYVSNWDPARKVVLRHRVTTQGTLEPGEVFFDMTAAPGAEALDGLKVDQAGNVYVSGPGGVWILSPSGVHLGTLVAPRLPANFAWGDADGRTLYLTARSDVYRIRLGIPGVR
jgi:gluconolactonase